MKAQVAGKKKRNDVIWKGYPESYTDAELVAFGESLKGVSRSEAEFMFGARNHKGAVIVTMQSEGTFEKYVRPYPIELFEHKYEAWSKMVSRQEFIEKKKLEGLAELAEGMNISQSENEPVRPKLPKVEAPSKRRELLRSALNEYKAKHNSEYAVPIDFTIIEDVI